MGEDISIAPQSAEILSPETPAAQAAAQITPPESAPAPSLISPQLIAPAIKSLFDTADLICEAKLGKKGVWALSKPEVDNLSSAMSPVLNKYMAEWIKKHPELAALAFTGVIVLAPRAITTAALISQKNKKVERQPEAPQPVAPQAPQITKTPSGSMSMEEELIAKVTSQ